MESVEGGDGRGGGVNQEGGISEGAGKRDKRGMGTQDGN